MVTLAEQVIEVGSIDAEITDLSIDRDSKTVKGKLSIVTDGPVVRIGVRCDAEFRQLYIERDNRGTPKYTDRLLDKVVALETSVEISEEPVVIPIEVPLPTICETQDTYIDGRVVLTPRFVSISEKGAQQDSVFGTPQFAIDPSVKHQVIDGFGASGCWWSQYVGGSPAVREKIADLLFSTDKGIGLTQYRYNAGAGIQPEIRDPWRTAETFEVERGVYDWARDANARWFLQAAKERGVKDFILFVNSPPARITKNHKTWADKGANTNLSREMYGEFAQYLADIIKHFRDDEGIEFNWLSPVNEPEWEWSSPSQEGCPYTVDQIVELSKVILDTLQREGLDTELLVPEAGTLIQVYMGRDYADRLLSDPVLSKNLSVLAAHSYWSTDHDRKMVAQKMQRYPQQRLWQTEWCEMVGGRDLGMDQAINLARTVHADLTIANASAWQFWLAVSRYDFRDGLIYVSSDYQSAVDAKSLWALGNYSRFIRPGATRIDVRDNYAELSGKRHPGIYVSAYLHEEDNRLTIVAVNELKTETEVNVTIPAEKGGIIFIPYRTSETEALQKLRPVKMETSGDGLATGYFKLAPRSVTTYVAEYDLQGSAVQS